MARASQFMIGVGIAGLGGALGFASVWLAPASVVLLGTGLGTCVRAVSGRGLVASLAAWRRAKAGGRQRLQRPRG